MQLEIEEQALRKEKDAVSQNRLEALRDELTELKESSAGMREQWDSEKETLRGIQEKREQLDRFRRELEEAENRFDLNKAAELTYGKIPDA